MKTFEEQLGLPTEVTEKPVCNLCGAQKEGEHCTNENCTPIVELKGDNKF